MIAIDPDTRALLDRFGFDEARLDAAAAALAAGGPAVDNAVRGTVTAPADGDVVALPAPGTASTTDACARRMPRSCKTATGDASLRSRYRSPP